MSERHLAFSLGDVVNLFSTDMLVTKCFATDRDDGFGKALVCSAVNPRVHEFPDLRSILGDVWNDFWVSLQKRDELLGHCCGQT